MLTLVTAVSLALVPVPVSRPDKPLSGVERAHTLDFATPAMHARYLPAKSGVQLDFPPTEAMAVREVAEALPEPYAIELEPTSTGLRLRIIHPSSSGIRATATKRGDSFQLVLGTRDEETRLRKLANIVRAPLPQPRDLGAHLELWLDAERAMADGDLRFAARLWEKLEQASHLDDLAALRLAELYLISGHISEAQARLRAVSRRFPRSSGASLARLDLQHIEAIVREGEMPTLEQIELAAQTVDRQRFEPYAWMRVAFICDELGWTTHAVARLPEPDTLPPAWEPVAARRHEAMLERAIATPVLFGDPLTTAVAFDAWTADVERHPNRADLIDAAIEAQSRLGLFDETLPLLRGRLRDLPETVDEGVLVARLAEAYHAKGDAERLTEVLTFAAQNHPRMPGLPALARGLALMTLRERGLAAAQQTIAALAQQDPDLAEPLATLAADLALAYGDAQAQARALAQLATEPETDPRGPALALALARAGRAQQAAPLLRTWIGKTTDPQARDQLAYHLFLAENALGNADDAQQILEVLSRHGTRYGLIARAALRERQLESVLGSPAPQPEGT